MTFFKYSPSRPEDDWQPNITNEFLNTFILRHLGIPGSLFSSWFSHKWSCKNFGGPTDHWNLTYTSVHFIGEDVAYSIGSLVFGPENMEVYLFLLC